MTESTALATQQATAPSAIQAAVQTGMALTFEDMRARVVALNDFYEGVMQAGTDYDTLPGTPKPTLLQPGAQLLDGIFGLAPTFEEMPSSVRDFERGFFFLELRCRLVSKDTGRVAAEGIGSCNSKEDKYRWRTARRRRCPACQAETIIKGKKEYGGGWLCFKKQGGCGATYRDGDAAIEGQIAGRIENDDPYTLLNTISKMAQKRAHVAATLNATGASRIFTQDVEDLPRVAAASPPPAPPVTDPPGPAGASAGPPAAAVAVAPDGAAPAGPPPDEARPIPFPEQPPAGEPARITGFYELTREGWRMTRAETRERLGFPYADLSDADAVKAALDRLGLPHDNAGLKDLYERASANTPAPVTA